MHQTRELSASTKFEITTALQNNLCHGKLPRGTIKAIAARFDLNRGTIRTVWTRYKNGVSMSRKTGRVGPRTRYTAEEITTLIKDVPLQQRSTLRDLSEATGISTFTLSRSLKNGVVHRRSSRLKPLLTEYNKRERIAFCAGHVELTRDAAQEYMADVAEGDCRKAYLVDGEDMDYRACKSKRFIAKVMFLCAVARPRDGFDGKIGLWPFVKRTPALRSSRNRQAGTLVTTLVNVDGPTYRDYLVNKVVPAIKAKFPSMSKRVVLQHDNATPHGSIDEATLALMSTDGWQFVVRRQPPNSPDLNVLDLGFFASIQSLQYKTISRSVDEVIASTLMAFETLSDEKLAKVFLTLQAVMRLVLEHRGNNNFKLPHLKKDAMGRAGTLTENLSCCVSLLVAASLHYH
ncbi:hypothetical protein H310_03616 [Aphanomyces invadans]|uniref:Transposase Tc1-like domain-containing protein n=1 Tax=Aphanomyces invadans TaxID=157072 RepID=A0A024UJG8_9STRA|nr:hypothetical protein H310_03616 [Aphanomyces invadans]ETW05997.1 hypothetical protein H310_03616 [Aphanomyces invadans]|eukprot:XP_008865774.1 hypothetical protein H310_03616 [Aphanomyces invadans]